MRAKNTLYRAIMAIVTLCIIVGCGDDDKNTPMTLEGLLTQVTSEYEMPGMAAARITSDSIQTAVAGVRKLGTSAKIAPPDMFHIGSNTKAMTADIIAHLVEQGELNWTSKPSELIPGLADSIHPGFANITLAEILTHRAGIQGFTYLEEFEVLPEFPVTGRDQREEFARWLLQRPPTYGVGTYQYSNAGYGIAAAMAEAASDRHYESDLIHNDLFEPLGIAGVLGWPAAADPNEPWGHYEEGGEFFPHDPFDEYVIPPCVVPAGDVSMSIGQYAEFVQWHLRAMRGMPAFLSAASFTKLHTPVGQYAMGWGVTEIGGSLTYAHEGSAGTFDVLVAIQPDRNIAVAVFINAAGEQSLTALNEVAAEVLGIDETAASKLTATRTSPLRY